MMWTYIWRGTVTAWMVLMTVEMWKLLKWQMYQQVATDALVQCNIEHLKALLTKIEMEEAENEKETQS